MRIGIPKEIKNRENRVAITPAGVHALVSDGHEVLIEKNAGLGSAITDEAYIEEGAKIVDTAEEAWDVDMIIKVKEPVESEYKYFKEGLIIFAYFHMAAVPELAQALLDKKVTAIAYETVGTGNDRPLLKPMSQVAGKMATIIGAEFLQSQNGGSGVLVGGVPGVEKGKVTILGGGNVGINAIKMAVGLGARVTVLDLSLEKMAELENIFGNTIDTKASNPKNIHDAVIDSDLVVGAVLVGGGRKAPTLVREETVKQMRPGSVIVDVAVDQGGIFETIDHSTSHDDPIYVKHGVIHYAVDNIPGAVAQTSTYALTNATLPYARKIASGDLGDILKTDEALKAGVNTYKGKFTSKDIAEDLGIEYSDILE
ncbi:alanine dehydrogenase [Helcococcus massiliensis]|uniref:alanine dehydrogenase n=1 Tax=Helcococcus massiliensis TaxID=2040290 RepID=UPI000CDEC166|nr:alanine dehydrogenase [Helcococcus massiliensis]